MRSLFIVLITALITSGIQAEESNMMPPVEHNLLNSEFSVASGNSESPLFRTRASWMANITKLRFRVNDSCVLGNVRFLRIEIEYEEGAPRKYYKLDENGDVTLDKKGFLGFGIDFYNPNPYLVSCFIVVTGIEGEATPVEGPIKFEEFVLANSLTYEGGFQRSLLVTVAPQNPVTHIWVRKPDFCQAMEILEVRYGTNQGFERAKLVDQEHGVYAVASTEGVRINDVLVSANGPRDLSCDVPIYIRSLGVENPWP